jgi:mycothiol synthase
MRHILKIHRPLTDPLPTTKREYAIRTFDPEKDKDRWLALNNKAFVNHPDQGNWAIQDLENRMAESWFDPAGFFLATKGDEIIGFVWTKIHQDFVNQEPVGELYVVGVDPDHAHQGIGRAVSVAALNYLVAKGLKHSMLYVDADNEVGKRLYESLEFS